jgi:hypothetical protein
MLSASMRRRNLLLGLSAAFAAACGRSAPQSATHNSKPALPKPNGREGLGELAAEYERLMAEHGAHEWARYAGKLSEGAEASETMARLRRYEARVFSEARALLDAGAGASLDARQVELWQHGALGLELLGDADASTLADELEGTINDHRFELDGRVVSRQEIAKMRRSPDATLRRRTRTLEHGLHVRAAPIAKRLLQRRRQIAARRAGDSFHAILSEVRGVDARCLAELDRVEHATRQPFESLLTRAKQALKVERLAPWDLDYALDRIEQPPGDERFPADRALSSGYALYRGFGIDLEHPPLNVTVRDFAFGGQAIAVKVPSDVRLVVRPSPGARFYTTLIHELGHAYAITRTVAAHPLYAGYEWIPGLMDPAYAEGIAEVFGRMFDEPDVLVGHFGLERAVAERLVAHRRVQAIVSARRTLTAVHLERALHDAPEGADLDALSLATERRLSRFDLPPDTEPVWATTPFLATYPAYTQSYLIAAMVAVQVRDALKARFPNGLVSAQAGTFLTEHFVADGARLTLNEKLVRTTGRALDARPFLAFAVGA